MQQDPFFLFFFYSHWHKGAVWTELNFGASWLSLCWIWLRLSWGERKPTNSRLKWALFRPHAHFISWHAGKLQRSSTVRPLLTSTVTLTLAAHCSIEGCDCDFICKVFYSEMLLFLMWGWHEKAKYKRFRWHHKTNSNRCKSTHISLCDHK